MLAVLTPLLRRPPFRGGRGDRFVHGSPLWVLATALAVYLTVLVMTMIDREPIGTDGLAPRSPRTRSHRWWADERQTGSEAWLSNGRRTTKSCRL